MPSIVRATCSAVGGLLLTTPALAAEQWRIEEIVVTAPRVAPYSADDTRAATRTPTPIHETPQSVQVLTRALVDDQGLHTLTDALANVSGVVPFKPSEVVLANPIVRGFAAEIYVDGLPAYGTTPSIDPASLVNVERIEVVKGPTGSLYGAGVGAPVGGIINVVSRTPMPQRTTSAGIRAGSFDTVNPYVDFNHAFGDGEHVRLRLTGDYLDSDDVVDEVDIERLSLYPALWLSLGSETELTLRGQFNRIEQLEYSGLPAAITIVDDLGIDEDRFSGATDAPRTEIENTLVTAQLTHVFSPTVEGRLAVRYYDSEFDEYGTFVFPAFYPPVTQTAYPILKGYLPTDVEQWTASGTIVATATTGVVEHVVLVGVDVDSTDYFAALGVDFLPIGIIDYADPASDAPFGDDPALTTEQDDHFQSTSFFVQDQATIAQRLHLQFGLRFTRLDFEQHTSDVSQTYHELTPRVGVSFDLTDSLAAFAGYGEGFRGVLNFLSASSPEPETSDSYEVGLKIDDDEFGLSGTLALFSLTRDNVATADPNNPFLQIQAGEQEATGVELDLIYEPVPSVSMLISYAHTNAEVERDSTLPQGDRLARIPEDAGRLAGRYRFLSGTLAGLELGVGLTARSEREITLPNSVATEDLLTVDLQASYSFGRVAVSVDVVNMTDESEFEPYQYLAQAVVTPTQPRSAFVTLSTDF